MFSVSMCANFGILVNFLVTAQKMRSALAAGAELKLQDSIF